MKTVKGIYKDKIMAVPGARPMFNLATFSRQSCSKVGLVCRFIACSGWTGKESFLRELLNHRPGWPSVPESGQSAAFDLALEVEVLEGFIGP